MKGVVSITLWNIFIVGVISLAAILVWNEFAAGKNLFGLQLGRA